MVGVHDDGVRVVRIALLGFGAVNKAFVRMLVDKAAYIKREHGVRFEVCAVCTPSRGCLVRAGPTLDFEKELLPMCESRARFETMQMPLPTAPAFLSTTDGPLSVDAAEVETFWKHLASDPVSCAIVAEAVPVCYETAMPALGYARAALSHGMHFVSANKGPVVHAYDELKAHEARGGPKYRFESAVMDGCPIFNMARACMLPATRIVGFSGILNSTSNIIVSEMERGKSFDDAVRKAQADGIAETDPSGDVDGWDAAVKCLALARVLFTPPADAPDGTTLTLPKLSDIKRESVRALTRADIEHHLAPPSPRRYKMLCSGRIVGTTVELSVRVALVEQTSPLYGVAGASACVEFYFENEALAPTSIVSTNPTNKDTAFGVLVDAIACVK